MKSLKISKEAKNAIFIGTLCSVAYLAVYVAKNALSAVAPQITGQGAFTVEEIGVFSSAYYITYAIGQLINGIIGDKIKAKIMISFGLIFAALVFLAFPFLTDALNLATVVYAASGFFLAMIYAPLTKVVAENTKPEYATRCSLGYTLSSFLGSPVSGYLAAFMTWQSVFFSCSAVLAVMGVCVFVCFSFLEHKGIVRYGRFVPQETSPIKNIKVLIKREIIRFALVAIITGIVRTSVVFWLPTYISQYLGFNASDSALIFSVSTLALSFSAFIAVFSYERLNRNIHLVMLLGFIFSSISFLSLFFVKNATANIIIMVVAILSSNCASSILWSRYCPSLFDTGMVSSATGFLDFCSYMAASAASLIFANAVNIIGWDGLILVWFAIVFCGIFVSIKFKKADKEKV